MKINIKNESIDFNVYLPSSCIKSNLLLRSLNVDKKTRTFIKQTYKLLKKYSKENNHFDFVEITKDDSKITIRI